MAMCVFFMARKMAFQSLIRSKTLKTLNKPRNAMEAARAIQNGGSTGLVC